MWLFINDNIINAIAVSQVPGIETMDASQRGIILSEIRQAADGKAFVEIRPEVAVAAESLNSFRQISRAVMFVAALALSVFGAFFAYRLVARRFRARHSVERSITWFMLFCFTCGDPYDHGNCCIASL